MNKISVKRARRVLKKVGNIRNRVIEKEKARLALEKDILTLQKRPSQRTVLALNKSIDALIEKERNLLRNQNVESKKVEKLQEMINSLEGEHEAYEDQIKDLKRKLKEYDKLAMEKERKKKTLHKKVKKAIDIDEDTIDEEEFKISKGRKKELETKMKDHGVLSDNNKEMKNRIELLEQRLHRIKDPKKKEFLQRKINEIKKQI